MYPKLFEKPPINYSFKNVQLVPIARLVRNCASDFFTITNEPVKIDAPKEDFQIPEAPVLDKRIARLSAKIQTKVIQL